MDRNGKLKLYARTLFNKRDHDSEFTNRPCREINQFTDFYVCWRRRWEFNCNNRSFGIKTAAQIFSFLHAGVRAGGDGPAGHLPGQSDNYSQLP